MIKIYYNPIAFAFCANNNEDEIVLCDNSIYFYDGNGVIATLKASHNISFSLQIGKPFTFRAKENFSRGEVFAVRKKKEKYDTNAKYKLYIPSKYVNLVNRGEVFELSYKEIFQNNYNVWEIEASNIEMPYPNMFFKKKNGFLSFREFTGMKNTEKGEYLENLSKEIKELCGINLEVYNLVSLTEFFNITKKEKENEQA